MAREVRGLAEHRHPTPFRVAAGAAPAGLVERAETLHGLVTHRPVPRDDRGRRVVRGLHALVGRGRPPAHGPRPEVRLVLGEHPGDPAGQQRLGEHEVLERLARRPLARGRGAVQGVVAVARDGVSHVPGAGGQRSQDRARLGVLQVPHRQDLAEREGQRLAHRAGRGHVVADEQLAAHPADPDRGHVAQGDRAAGRHEIRHRPEALDPRRGLVRDDRGEVPDGGYDRGQPAGRPGLRVPHELAFERRPYELGTVVGALALEPAGDDRQPPDPIQPSLAHQGLLSGAGQAPGPVRTRRPSRPRSTNVGFHVGGSTSRRSGARARISRNRIPSSSFASGAPRQ